MSARSVFISHSSRDDATVREIRQALAGFGIETWADSERLSGGELLHPIVKEAIENADTFLAVVGLNALNSQWVQNEIRHALTVGKKVVPLTQPGIGAPVLRLLFNEELVAIRLGPGPSGVRDALPQILSAIGIQVPTRTLEHVQVHTPPIADLVLELSDPAIEDIDGRPRATAVAILAYLPPDSSPRVESPRFPFTAPIGPIESEEIAWYLERYINWPSGLFEERAKRTVEALPQWGRLLYATLNADGARQPLEVWRSMTGAERRFTVKVDKELIVGTPQAKQTEADLAATLLLSLPWELIHDDDRYLFHGQNAVRVRRSLPRRGLRLPFATEPPIRVLVVSPRPEDESAAYIDHRILARPLIEALSQLGNLARFKLLEPATFPAFETELKRAADAGEPYHVIHFDGHGGYDPRQGLGILCFEDPADREKSERRRSQLIDADKIASVVRDHRISLFFLDASLTARFGTDPSASVAARLLESGVNSVVAMSHSVLVETARLFTAEFYKELVSGKRIGQAMLAGQQALASDTFRGKTFTGEVRLEDWFVPVLFQEELDLQLIRTVPAQQVTAVIEKTRSLALGELPPPPPHQFLGRSRDLLKAERVLAWEPYLVVKGAGGEGKTTFAAELARWLVATRRFNRAVFTSVEQVTGPSQILFSIGGQLIPNFAGRAGTDQELGLQLVERALADQSTVLVIDNMESILKHSCLEGILKLCATLGQGRKTKTRLIFTTREALPHPFASNVLSIGRLDRHTAIRLIGNLLPSAPESSETQQDLENLVDVVGGHALSLVLIAREVGAVGVRRATENLREVLLKIEARHPGEREKSLLASANLSVRRLPAEIQQLVRPLSVFHGGGSLGAIALALKLDPDRVRALATSLIGVGLAEYVEPGYLGFDPGLIGGDLLPTEHEAATIAWAEASAAVIEFLYQQQFKDAKLAGNLVLLEMPNLLAALAHLARSESPEHVVDLATRLEQLIANLNRPEALSRVVEIRTLAAQRLGRWGNPRFEAERATIDRLLEQGRHGEAVQAAHALYLKAEAAGDAAYEGAAYDVAIAQITLGRALQMSGDAGSALAHLDAAQQRFEGLNSTRMANAALTGKADSLMDLGHYDEAAAAYEQAIRMAEPLGDLRGVAVGKGQLATVRRRQMNFSEALQLYDEVRKIFERLNEPASVATAWHQSGKVHMDAGQYDAAEQAYQKSLNLKVQTGNRVGQASTLGELGNLYSHVGRSEDAVRMYRQAAEIFASLGDIRSEGITRSNTASDLLSLRRYEEARFELERALECQKPFGHAAQPWKTLSLVAHLERLVGNDRAALEARNQASAAYLAYRRDGGAPQIDAAEVISIVHQDAAGARALLDDPTVHYLVIAEIVLALERLDADTESISAPSLSHPTPESVARR